MPLRRSRLLHGAGLLLLGLACAVGRVLTIVEAGCSGHEPAAAYPLALVTFLLGSSGVTLAVSGPRLFRKVVVADRWLPHVPIAFREQDKDEARPGDLPGSRAPLA